jgi:hypothetical protein
VNSFKMHRVKMLFLACARRKAYQRWKKWRREPINNF